MSRKKSYQERIDFYKSKKAECEEKSKKYDAEIKQLERKQSEEERKARTHRLIRIGGIAEAILDRAFEEEDFGRFEAFLVKQERNGKFYSSAMNRQDAAQLQQSEAATSGEASVC